MEQGTSPENAIVVKNIDAEYKWLKKHYPAYRLRSQSLQKIDDKTYDVFEISDQTQTKRTLYFDISQFFGKS